MTSGEELRQIDRICDRFESELRRGNRTSLRGWIEQLEPDLRAAALVELLAVDVQFRKSAGQIPDSCEYQQEFPEYAETIDREFQLASAPDAANGRTSRESGEGLNASTASFPAIPGFRFLRELGRGGAGIVDLVAEDGLNRLVALKRLRIGRGASWEERARFYAEADSAAALQHPNIVRIFQVGQHNGEPYCVMEYLGAGSLRSLIASGPLPPRQAASLVAKLANALSHAHSRGIVHRDLKPGNILLDHASSRDPEIKSSPDETPESFSRDPATLIPKISDFGLARSLQSGHSMHTATGQVLGTPQYLSPEQALGRSNAVDGRSDIYSLGVVLYELLSGRVPFEGEIASVLYGVVHDEPPRPGKFCNGIPAQLETICAKAMSKEPGGRYATAEEFEYDLRAWLDHRPIRARRAGPLGRLALWSRRQPALAATLAATALIIMSMAVFSYLRVVDERNRYRAERDRAEQNLYQALISDATSQLSARDTGWYWNVMEIIGRAAGLDGVQGQSEQLRDLALECHSSRYPSLRLVSQRIEGQSPVGSLAVSPVAPIAASGCDDGSIALWNYPESGHRTIFESSEKPVTGLAFHPEKPWLFSASMDGTVSCWDIRSMVSSADSEGRELQIPRISSLTLDPRGIREVDISPDGNWIAAAGVDGTVRMIPVDVLSSAADQSTVVELKGHREAVTCLAFSPDNQLLVSGGLDNTIRFWSVVAKGPVQTWTVRNAPGAIRFDGRNDQVVFADPLAFGFSRRGILDSENVEGQQLHANAIQELLLTKNRQVFSISEDGSVKLWPITGFEPQAVAEAELPPALSGSLSPDEQHLLVGHQDGRVCVWEIRWPSMANTRAHSLAFVGESRIVNSGLQQWDAGRPMMESMQWLGSEQICSVARMDNNQVVLGDGSGRVRILDAKTRESVRRWSAHDSAIVTMAADPAGDRLVTGGSDGMLRLWNTRDGSILVETGPEVGVLHQLTWNSSGTVVAASGEAGAVIWDPRDNSVRRISHVPQFDSGIAWNEQALVTCGVSGTIQVRDPLTADPVTRLETAAVPVTALALSPDGSRLASMSQGGVLRIWNTADWSLAWTQERRNSSVEEIVFDSSGRYLLACGWRVGGTNTLWDVSAGQPIGLLDLLRTTAATTPDGTGFLVGSEFGGLVEYSPAKIQAERKLSGELSGDAIWAKPEFRWINLGGVLDPVWGVAASPDGRQVAIGTHHGQVKLWDVSTATWSGSLSGHQDVVWCVAYGPDSGTLVSGSSTGTSDGGEILIWDLNNRTERFRLRGHESLVRSAVVEPQGKWLVSAATDGSILVWDLNQGKLIGQLHKFDRMVTQLALRHDGATLVAACDDRLAVWDFGKIREQLAADRFSGSIPDRLVQSPDGPLWAVAWAPKGEFLATGTRSGVVGLWDGTTMEPGARLKSGPGEVRGLAFSRDGQFLAAAKYSNPTVIWDLPELEYMLTGLKLTW